MDIKKALKLLDKENKGQWTSDGQPLVNAVSHIIGYEVTRKQITDAWPDFSRDTVFEEDKEIVAEKEKVVAKVNQDETTLIKDMDNKINKLSAEKDSIVSAIYELTKIRNKASEHLDTQSGHMQDTQTRLLYIKSQDKLRRDKFNASRSVLKYADPRDPIDRKTK